MRMECFSSWKSWYRTTHQGLVFLQGDWQLARRKWSSHNGCWGEDGNDLSCFNVSTDLGRFVLSFRETPTYGGNGAVTAPYHAINIAGTCEKFADFFTLCTHWQASVYSGARRSKNPTNDMRA